MLYLLYFFFTIDFVPTAMSLRRAGHAGVGRGGT